MVQVGHVMGMLPLYDYAIKTASLSSDYTRSESKISISTLE